MAPPLRFLSWSWLPVALLAGGFLWRIDVLRFQRVHYNSQLAGRAEAVDVIDPQSPTGYAHSQRELIIPERNEDSQNWILQTQQMFSQHQWRVRHVDYDNAPTGRAVSKPSPYRWWLGTVSWFDHIITGKPIGLSVEQAALYSDPLMHGLLLILLAAFVALHFGNASATLFSLGFATFFPFAANFLPGEPDDRGLAAVLGLASLLVLLVGLQKLFAQSELNSIKQSGSRARRWFIAAGVVAGLALWVSVPVEVPVIGGVFLGGLIVAFAFRSVEQTQSAAPRIPWRPWAWSGAITSLVGYLIEYFPSHLWTRNLEFIHPLYALAWIAIGELLIQLTHAIQYRTFSKRPLDLLIALGAIAAFVPIAVIMKTTDTRGFLGVDLMALRLSKLPGSPLANSLWAWSLHDGMPGLLWITLAPLSIIIVSLWSVRRRLLDPVRTASILLLLGPGLIALGYATKELTRWSAVDVVALVMIAAALAQTKPLAKPGGRWLVAILTLVVASAGTIRLWPNAETRAGGTLTPSEAELLIERDLAHWLAKRTGNESAVILASPRLTMSQCYYGNLHGIGTINTDNRGGLGATIAIVSATTMEEAQALMEKHEVKYIVIPSWDTFFENYTHTFLAKSFSGWNPFFIPELKHWHLPPWLRPVPYDLPKIGGYESQSVLVFEVVNEQNPAVAMSRLAEYMVEVGNAELAARADDGLRRFPGDVGALAARAQVATARGDGAELDQVLNSLLTRLGTGADRYLLWDRRVSLAIVLARAQEIELARTETKRCIDELNIKQARQLSTGLLYNLLVVSQSLNIPIQNPELRDSTLNLLPPDLRNHL